MSTHLGAGWILKGWNNERGNNADRKRTITLTRSSPLWFLTHLAITPSIVHFSVFEWQWFSRPSEPTPPLPHPLSLSIPSSLWSVGVNQSLVLTQIGNKYPRVRETIMTELRWKWIPTLTPHAALPFSRPTGSCHGKQLSLDASWQSDSTASAIGPPPQAFSRQIASSSLKSNLLPTLGSYQRSQRFLLFLWTMNWGEHGHQSGHFDFWSTLSSPSHQCQ